MVKPKSPHAFRKNGHTGFNSYFLILKVGFGGYFCVAFFYN